MALSPRTSLYVTLIVLIGVVAVSLYGTMIFLGWGIGGASADEALVTPAVAVVPTQVCGPYMNPQIVGGMPVEITGDTIRFQDGYVLVLKHAPSMYLDRLGYLQIKDREVEAYALAAKQFNPCPPDPEAGK